MIITLAGHVDHGKTALVKAITGTDTDCLNEEKQRGLTIDLGFAYTSLNQQKIGFVDVPGHHRFIHNMIAGVASMQHALLVIAADDGPMPQTREHLQILELLGLKNGTIALNKTDKVTPEHLASAREKIRRLLKGSFLECAQMIETSATTGNGVEQLKNVIAQHAQDFQQSLPNRGFRMPIDRTFSLRGVGTIVTGTITSGEVLEGDSVVVTKNHRTARVRSLNVQSASAMSAHAGDRCSLNLVGIEANALQRGDWVSDTQSFCTNRVAVAQIKILSDFPRTIKHWSPIHLYHFSDHTEARIALQQDSVLKSNSIAWVELLCARSMQFKIGDRVILRDRDLQRTIGGATILDLRDQRTTRRNSQWKRRIERLSLAVETNDVSHAIEILSEDEPRNIEAYRCAWNLQISDFESHVEMADVLTNNGFALNKTRVTSLSNKLTDVLKQFHSAHANANGASLHYLCEAVREPADDVELVLGLLLNGDVKRVAGMYALVSHQPATENFDEARYRNILKLIDRVQPSSSGDVAKTLKLPYHTVENELARLCRVGKFIRVARNRYFTPGRITELIKLAIALSNSDRFSVRQYRDASGLGRNWVIDLLEYMDRNQFTRRDGDVRFTTDKAVLFVKSETENSPSE